MDLTAAFRSLVIAEQARQNGAFVRGVDVERYLDKLDAKAEILADVAGGCMRGVVAYYCNDAASRRAYVSLVLVDPPHRGHGLGKALVSCVMDIARRRGFRSCRLEVAVANEPACAAYRSLGFEVVEERGDKRLLEAVL